MMLKYFLFLLCFLISLKGVSDPLIDDEEHSRFYVYSPTTLKETIHDAPAATTVITAEDIRNRGITRIEDIFRFAPGMVVNRGDGNPIRVAYHGTNSENPRRMLIKINGTTIPYHQHFQWTRWDAMPFHIDSIERVEIVRSPSNAIHGGNAAQGYINIILKDPEISRSMVTGGLGTNNRNEFSIRQSLSNNSSNSLYFSFGSRKYDGYDQDYIDIKQRILSPLPSDISELGEIGSHDGWERSYDEHESLYGSLNGAFKFDKTEIGLLIGVYNVDYNNRPIIYGNEYVSLIDERHSNEVELQTKQHFITLDFKHNKSDSLILGGYASYSHHEDQEQWVDCRWANITWWPETYDLYDYSINFANSVFRPTLNQNIDTSNFTVEELQAWGPFANRVMIEGINSAQRDICGNWYQKTTNDRVAAQVDMKIFLQDHTKIVLGAGGVSETVFSEEWYQGEVSEQRIHFLTHVTNYIGPFTSNFGIYSQKFSLNDKIYNSPRFAISYRLSDFFSLKAISAISYSEPPIFARQADFAFDLTFDESSFTNESSALFFWHLKGNPEIEAERIKSKSIVFSGQSPGYPFSFNIKLFDEEMTEVISDLYNWTSFDPSNNGKVDQEGIEIESNLYKENYSVGVSASYIENQTNSFLEQSLYAKNIYTVYASKRITDNTNVSFYSNHNNILDVEYNEYNIFLNNNHNVGRINIDFFLQLTYYPEEKYLKTYKSSFDLPNDYVVYTSRYDDEIHGFAGFKVNY